MKKSKRLLAFVMSIVMLMSVLFSVNISAMARRYEENTLAPNGQCGTDVTYTYDKDTGLLTISGTGAMTDYDYYYDSIFYDVAGIKEVVVEEGVTSIGDYSFEDCNRITKVTLPEGLVNIGSRAFAYVGNDGTGIDHINLPSTLQTIGEDAFDMVDIFRVEYNGTYDALCKLAESGNIATYGNYGLFTAAVIQTTDNSNGVWVNNEDGSFSYKVNDAAVKGFVYDNGKAYYIDDEFKMVTGLQELEKLIPNVNGNDFAQNLYYFDETGAMVHNSWYGDEIGWRYFAVDGRMVRDDLFEMHKYNSSEKDLYHFNTDGYMQTGWFSKEFIYGPNQEDVEVEWFYFYPNGIAASEEWLQDSQGWVYMGYYGNMIKEEMVPDTWGFRYVDENGRICENGWVQMPFEGPYRSSGELRNPQPEPEQNFTWIYIDEYDYVATDRWVTDSQGWLYVDEEGMIVTDGVAEDSYGPVYLGIDGHPEEYKLINSYGISGVSGFGPHYPNERPCFYAGAGGYLSTGWQYVYIERNDSYEWLYFNDNYWLAVNQWIKDSQGWLHIGHNGIIDKLTLIEPDSYFGAVYYVNEEGRLASGWNLVEVPFDSGYGWIYADENSIVTQKGWVQDSTGWCYIQDYLMVVSDWVNLGGYSYYIDENGHMVTGAYEINGRTFEFAANGALIA